ncbi:MAG: hypothetical protein LBO63_02875 [Oscillospiraceae bacterium]|jgi:hypothetical protein|nr:hypothetical protein [Oscillospiraceae bacterium]
MNKLKITILAGVFAACFLLASCKNSGTPATSAPPVSPTAPVESPSISAEVPTATPDEPTPPAAPGIGVATDGWVLTYKGADIYLGSKLDDLIAKVGEPTGRHETADCAFGAVGYTIDFRDSSTYLRLTTTQFDGVDCIMTIEFMDDSVKTNEGLQLGDSADKVKEALGEPQETQDTIWKYIKGGTSLWITVEGAEITNVQYFYDAAVTE